MLKMKYIMKSTKSFIVLTALLSLAACGTENRPEQSVAVPEGIVIQGQEAQNTSPDAPEGSEENGRESANTAVTGFSPQTFDYETLGIKEYEYPSEFSMGDNLQGAITQLALSYENFDKVVVNGEGWKEIFIARFIQNSRFSFDYLDEISDKNNGQISTDELNYIQYSLTGVELDFSSYAGGPVDRYDAASPLNYGSISGYDYAYTENGVVVTASFETGYDGADSTQVREITVELAENPYSCFNGYSVLTVSAKAAASGDNANHAAQIQKEDELENLTGEYEYVSDYGSGKLMIVKTSDGYDISDYESESSYRFLADSSNIESIENSRIYIKYPEQVFSDDTVRFCYYILEYGTEEIKVYYGKSLQEEAQFLYCATKEKEEDTSK